MEKEYRETIRVGSYGETRYSVRRAKFGWILQYAAGEAVFATGAAMCKFLSEHMAPLDIDAPVPEEEPEEEPDAGCDEPNFHFYSGAESLNILPSSDTAE